MERVAVLKTASGHKAYPFFILKKQAVLKEIIDGETVVFFSRKNTRSPLDRRLINQSRLIIS
ncbi:MAG: hypothetical protein EP297_15115, partial [Gammaproteobacteria bacterium]